jgi:hypothetical protein
MMGEVAEITGVEVSGHIHNFQHIRVPGSEVDYVVNTSASLTRGVAPFEGTLFKMSELQALPGSFRF